MRRLDSGKWRVYVGGDARLQKSWAAPMATINSTVPVSQPVPDLHLLHLRTARHRAERKFLGTRCPEHQTEHNRIDACCRRHANRHRRQSWQGICQSISKARGGARAWRLLRSLINGPAAKQPVLAVAICLAITEAALAEQLADRFTALPLVQPAADTGPSSPRQPQGNHQTWTASQIVALCEEPLREHELTAALAKTKRRSAPGADGIT